MNRTEYRKEYRKSHPSQRNKTRKANYASSRPKVRRKIFWTEEECMLILNATFTDRSLANYMNRSVQAIQQKRYKLTHNKGA